MVGSYGAFGSITRERHEVVIEGTQDAELSEHTQWREYELPGKPGDVTRRPRQWAPYHLRLDWSMWFLPFRVVVTSYGLYTRGHPRWFVRLLEKLLVADAPTLALFRTNPFPGAAPTHVRASFYRYQLLSAGERRRLGAHWRRVYLGEYFPPLNHAAVTASAA